MNWKKECDLPYLILEKKDEVKSLIKKVLKEDFPSPNEKIKKTPKIKM